MAIGVKLIDGPSDGKGIELSVIGGIPGGGGGTAAWDDVTGKPAVIAAGATQAAARTAIGAGTSSLAIGTTATTAAAGNHTHTIPQIDGLVDVINQLTTRVTTLEEQLGT